MKFLTVTEAAEIVRESPDTLRRRCSSGQIPATKVGKEWRISEDALALFMTPGIRKSPRQRLTERQRRQLGAAS